MSFVPFALVVLAALIHATWNLLAKRASPAGPAFVFFYSAVASICYLPWMASQVAWGSVVLDPSIAACVILSGVLHLGYSLCLQRGYQVADLSVVYPVARGSGPALSSAAAFLLLGESPTVGGVTGLVAVVAGIMLIAMQGDFRRFSQPGSRQGLYWGIATGSMIAAYTVVDGFGVMYLDIHPVVLDWCANAVRLVFLAPWVLAHRQESVGPMKGHWRLALAVGALSPLSYILVLQAIRMEAPVSVVAPLREMSMMIGALLGAIVLREHMSRPKVLGCLILMMGVALLVGSNS